MADPLGQGARIGLPDFSGMHALDAWLAGHDAGLILVGPDPDSPRPLVDGIVVDQQPPAGSRLHRWDVVTVWVRWVRAV